MLKWIKTNIPFTKVALKNKKTSKIAPLIAYNSVGQPIWTPRRYDALAEEGYQKNVIVYRAVNLITRSAASVPWRLFKGEKELMHSPLLDILHHPNPRQGGAAFIEAVLAYKLLSGNSYIEAVYGTARIPVELYPLRPDRMRVIPGVAGIPQGYEYSVNGKTRRILVDPLDGRSEILHIKMFHPLNDWYGMSPIEAAACSIDQHNSVAAHNLSLLQNGGRPSGVLKLNSKADRGYMIEEQRQNLRHDMINAYEGTKNAGRILILEGDFEWQEMGLSLKDLDFIEGKNLSAREIAQTYGVPSMLVGVPGDATFANYREARLHLWEDTILPLLDHLCDEFNHWLVPQFGNDLCLRFDIDSIPALGDRRENTWKKISDASFLTINEKRSFLGFAAIEGGDVLGERSENNARFK
jgi:HK97 family phage portal protein